MTILPSHVKGNEQPPLDLISGKNLISIGLATLDVLNFNLPIPF